MEEVPKMTGRAILLIFLREKSESCHSAPALQERLTLGLYHGETLLHLSFSERYRVGFDKDSREQAHDEEADLCRTSRK